MKYLLLLLLPLTALAAPSPFVFGGNFKMAKVASGACAIWWEGTTEYGGCETWDKWPGNWFEMVDRLKTGTQAERDADYASFGCTPTQADCSRLPADVLQLWANLYSSTKPQPAFVVQPLTGSTTRPYYKPNSTLTGIGAKLGNVNTGTACDQVKRLGTTNYYLVPSVSGYSICAAQ